MDLIMKLGTVALIGLGMLVLYMTVSRVRARKALELRAQQDRAHERLIADIEADNKIARARAEARQPRTYSGSTAPRPAAVEQSVLDDIDRQRRAAYATDQYAQAQQNTLLVMQQNSSPSHSSCDSDSSSSDSGSCGGGD